MKVIAALTADFERTFLGLPSRLTADLRGETVIRRTLRRLLAAKEPASVHLLVHASQEAVARTAVAGLDVAVETHDAKAPPWSLYVASGRKWSLDSWRGGLAGTMAYDEFAHPWLLDALARKQAAEAIVDVPAAAPLLDAGLLDRLIQHYAKVREETRLAVVQTAPGLSAIVYQAEFAGTIANAGHPPGRIMCYRPEEPQRELLLQPCLLSTDAVVSHGFGRCIADTSTSMARVDRILGELQGAGSGEPDAAAVSEWLRAQRHAAPPLPREIEIEITTNDPLPQSRLRPRGAALQRSGEMSFDAFRRIVDGMTPPAVACDDQLLVLGGFGDPLLHPQWPEFVRYAREKGILGIAIRTTAVNLDTAAVDALTSGHVDVLSVLLDADTAQTYRAVHGSDQFDRVLANIDRFCAVQQQRQCPRPLIACELTKTHATFDEMESFYDRWIRKTGSAVLVGPSRYAGEWPELAVMNMAPPARRPCSRLFSRTMILADGRMLACDQDFRGSHAVGSVTDSSIQTLWQAGGLARFRENHRAGTYADLPLCSACDEWHRA